MAPTNYDIMVAHNPEAAKLFAAIGFFVTVILAGALVMFLAYGVYAIVRDRFLAPSKQVRFYEELLNDIRDRELSNKQILKIVEWWAANGYNDTYRDARSRSEKHHRTALQDPHRS